MGKTEEIGWWGKYHIFIIGTIFAIITIGLWGGSWYYICNNPTLPKWTDKGTFGDMFGAINSLFSGLAFVGVIVAILLQRQELQLQRAELKGQREQLKLQIKELKQTREEFEQQNNTMSRQRFENTFFNMLKLHHEIIISMENNTSTQTGRMCIKYFVAELEDAYKREMKMPKTMQIIVRKIYDKFIDGKRDILGHYFRNLYNIIKFIDKASELSGEEKKVFTNLLRAQLSGSELYLLFFNCLSDDEYKPFKLLIEKYSLLKHIPKVTNKDKALYQSKAFDKNGDLKKIEGAEE